jgi:hypothetical protein
MKKTTLVKILMSVRISPHVPTVAALILLVDSNAIVNKGLHQLMEEQLVKIPMNVNAAHVDLVSASTHLEDSHALVTTDSKSVIMATVKISTNVQKLDNVKTANVLTLMVDSPVNVMKVIKKPGMGESVTTLMNVPETAILVERELVKTWMVNSNASVLMDSCQVQMDLVKMRTNV